MSKQRDDAPRFRTAQQVGPAGAGRRAAVMHHDGGEHDETNKQTQLFVARGSVTFYAKLEPLALTRCRFKFW